MSTKREKVIRTFPTNTDKVIEVAVRYSIGGMNYFAGESQPRGYYLGATPLTRTGPFVSYTMFSGFKTLLKPADRFSARVLAELEPEEADITKLVNAVALKNKLELAEAVSA